MEIVHRLLSVSTGEGITVMNVTPQVQDCLDSTGIQRGQALVFSRHTTTAIAINEDEARLLVDIRQYLTALAPPAGRYLHNDLHLRDVPPDEPANAHAHLMAMTLSSSEVIPVVEGRLALGTYQSILFFDLDGPRQRTLSVQISGLR